MTGSMLIWQPASAAVAMPMAIAIAGLENITGSRQDDILRGAAGTNVLLGGLGDDVLEGGADDDHLHGGDGSDTASYAHSTGRSNG